MLYQPKPHGTVLIRKLYIEELLNQILISREELMGNDGAAKLEALHRAIGWGISYPEIALNRKVLARVSWLLTTKDDLPGINSIRAGIRVANVLDTLQTLHLRFSSILPDSNGDEGVSIRSDYLRRIIYTSSVLKGLEQAINKNDEQQISKYLRLLDYMKIDANSNIVSSLIIACSTSCSPAAKELCMEAVRRLTDRMLEA